MEKWGKENSCFPSPKPPSLALFVRKRNFARCGELEQALGEKDLKRYATSVHAMKSSMRTLGIPSLPDTAQALEDAAKNGDAGFVAQHHAAFAAAVREQASAAAKCLS